MKDESVKKVEHDVNISAVLRTIDSIKKEETLGFNMNRFYYTQTPEEDPEVIECRTVACIAGHACNANGMKSRS